VLKNKKTAYILLPVTLIIWVLIGYKIYQFLNTEDEDLVLDTTMVAPSKDKLAGDSFIVFNNYRDPFLGNDGKELAGMGKPKNNYSSNSNTNYSSSTVRHNMNPKTPKNPVITPVVGDGWPKIVYHGMITNSSKQQSMGFVSIDGTSNRVKPGDKIGGDLKVIDFNPNEITIAKGKEKKTFGK
jgi:hypothetical protein